FIRSLQEAPILAAIKKKRQQRKRSPIMIEMIKNQDFKAGLNKWHSSGAMILQEENGNSVLLFRAHSFISQTAKVNPGDRLHYTIAYRAQVPEVNSPFVLRMRWVK